MFITHFVYLAHIFSGILNNSCTEGFPWKENKVSWSEQSKVILTFHTKHPNNTSLFTLFWRNVLKQVRDRLLKKDFLGNADRHDWSRSRQEEWRECWRRINTLLVVVPVCLKLSMLLLKLCLDLPPYSSFTFASRSPFHLRTAWNVDSLVMSKTTRAPTASL